MLNELNDVVIAASHPKKSCRGANGEKHLRHANLMAGKINGVTFRAHTATS